MNCILVRLIHELLTGEATAFTPPLHFTVFPMKKSPLYLLLALALGLLCACTSKTEQGIPLAACFDYGSGITEEQARIPSYVLYTDGTLIFRKRNGKVFTFEKLKLEEEELSELSGQISGILTAPDQQALYRIDENEDKPLDENTKASASMLVFFSEHKRSTVSLVGLAAIDVASLRLSLDPESFSKNANLPQPLLRYLLTIGLTRIAEADPLTTANSDAGKLFPMAERWQDLKLTPNNEVLPAVAGPYPKPAQPVLVQEQAANFKTTPEVDKPGIALPKAE